jgi:plastocyanin
VKKLIALVAAGAVAIAAVPAIAATKTKTIKVADNEFQPRSVTVKKGTKVRFHWVGKAPHNVTVTKGPRRFVIGTRQTGTVTKRLTRRGTYRIVCTIHPGMALKLKVR